MRALEFAWDRRLSTAAIQGARWLDAVHVWRPNATDALTTGDVETAAVLLSGTFDLYGGGTAWPARGARTTEFDGRPMAVFLPKRTEFRAVFLPKRTELRAERGDGEIVLVAARQPEAKPVTGRGVFGTSALLPLAGSGKAFDPNSGEWRPAETFPTSPESLPPRRMQRLTAGVTTLERVIEERDAKGQGTLRGIYKAETLIVERVIAPDYKAATLSIDELVLAQGQKFALRDLPARPPCDEMLVFVRAECETTFGTSSRITKLHGDGAFLVDPAELDTLSISVQNERAYVLVAYAGKPAV